MDLVLVSDPKYGGKYVAIKSFTDKTIVASGDDMSEVVFDARGKGFPEAIVTYVPGEDETLIF